MNRDQIIKGLECCTADGIHCDACPYDSKKTLTLCLCDLKADALSLINELTEENERLKERVDATAKQCGRLIMESDERDFERLKQIAMVRADTVRKFADKLIAYYNSLDGKTSSVLTAYHIEQIAKEMME